MLVGRLGVQSPQTSSSLRKTSNNGNGIPFSDCRERMPLYGERNVEAIRCPYVTKKGSQWRRQIKVWLTQIPGSRKTKSDRQIKVWSDRTCFLVRQKNRSPGSRNSLSHTAQIGGLHRLCSHRSGGATCLTLCVYTRSP